MYFHKAENKRPLILKRNENFEVNSLLIKDSYILYKGRKKGIVSSALIDIEVIMKNNPNIKSIMIVDPNVPLEVLKMRICETLEKFPKLSGLSGMDVKNLCIKNEKGLFPINPEGCSRSIKANDTLIFDIEFSEIWLEVEMMLHCGEKILKISFELKILCDWTIFSLGEILIKMGIKSWAKYIIDNDEDNENYDFYLFANFFINYADGTDIDMKNKVKNCFDFQSRILCKLEFTNFNEILIKEIVRISQNRSSFGITHIKVEKNRKKVIKKFVTEFLRKFCIINGKNSKFGFYKNILWRSNEDMESCERHRLSSILQVYGDTGSGRDSLVDDRSGFGYSTFYHNPLYRGSEKKLEHSSYPSPAHRIDSIDSLKRSKSSFKFDSKYTEDFLNLQKIDHLKFINEYSELFFCNKHFKHLDEPDTKNFKQLTRENSSSILKSYTNNSRRNSHHNQDFNFYLIKKEYYFYIKKKLPLLILIIVLVFLLVIIFYA